MNLDRNVCRVGVMLPSNYGDGPLRVVARARLAEDLGLQDLWVTDHLFFHQANGDALISASMAAAATTSIQVCFGVLQAAMYHPVRLAKQLGALSLETDGRILAGLGVGGDFRPEWEALGLSTTERGARFDEILDVLPPLLAGQPLQHVGRHYNFDVPGLVGPNKPAVPLWIGARVQTAVRRAVRADGVLIQYRWPNEFADDVAFVRAESLDAGRTSSPAFGALIAASVVGDDASARRRASDFLRSVYGLSTERAGKRVVGGVGQLRELLAAYAEAGADRVMVTLVDEPETGWPILATALG